MKTFFRRIHLYLSLAAGIFIMISCLTGSIMVFEDEFEHAFHRGRYYVDPDAGQKLPLDVLIQGVKEAVPGAKIVNIKGYQAANRSLEVGVFRAEKKENGSLRSSPDQASPEKKDRSGRPAGAVADKKGAGLRPNLIVFTNPYTGEILDKYSRKGSFFFQVEMLHRWLLTGNNGMGKKIMGLSAAFFFFILLTGIVLWWPRNKRILQQRLRIKTNANWKRLNHDLHLVTGFYTALFLIVIVSTGLMISYKWINKGIFLLTGSKIEKPVSPVSMQPNSENNALGLNLIETIIRQEYHHARSYTLRIPQTSADTYSIQVYYRDRPENAFDTYYYDQYSGKQIGAKLASERSTGEKIRSYVKPIHTGEVFGLSTKVLSFIVCILSLTFPVTGFMMWRNRSKSRKKDLQGMKATLSKAETLLD